MTLTAVALEQPRSWVVAAGLIVAVGVTLGRGGRSAHHSPTHHAAIHHSTSHHRSVAQGPGRVEKECSSQAELQQTVGLSMFVRGTKTVSFHSGIQIVGSLQGFSSFTAVHASFSGSEDHLSFESLISNNRFRIFGDSISPSRMSPHGQNQGL